MANPFLQVDGLTKSFGDLVLFEKIAFGIAEGQRIGLIAKNGSGKTTLLNILAGKEGYDEGSIVFRRDLKVGYLEQAPVYPEGLTVLEACFYHGNETVDLIREYERCMETPGNPGMDELLSRMDHANAWDYEQKAKQILSQLKIRDFNQPVGQLSGGQIKRVALANVLINKPDLLILDEPTNHLDMRSKDVLKEAIRDFDGTVILVSHDRDFLDGLATKVYEFGGGLVKEHLGGIYDFLKKKQIENLNELQKAPALSESPTAGKKTVLAGNDASQPSSGRLSYEEQKELNKHLKKLERRVADCEAEIEQTEAAIAIVESKMATPEGASDMSLYEQHQKLKQQLDRVMDEWEAASTELEEARK